MRLMDSCGCDWPQTISTGQHGTVTAKSIRSLFAPRANQIERGSKTAESGSLTVRRVVFLSLYVEVYLSDQLFAWA